MEIDIYFKESDTRHIDGVYKIKYEKGEYRLWFYTGVCPQRSSFKEEQVYRIDIKE